MKVKVKILYPDLYEKEYFRFSDKGDWIDLKSARDYELCSPQAGTKYKQKKDNDKVILRRDVEFKKSVIPLGIAMQLPKGFEAIVAPRSSTFKTFGIIQTNSIGIIDAAYCGDNDEWKMPVVALENATINKGDRICQFRIQLSQKATLFQKLKWLLSKRIKFIIVNRLDNKNRGGFGTSGIK